jgi:hypothetical protein
VKAAAFFSDRSFTSASRERCDHTWSALTPIGIQRGVNEAGELDASQDVQLANCRVCHTTLSRKANR